MPLVVRHDRARDGLPAGAASWSTVRTYPPVPARGRDLGTPRGVAALAVAALLAGGCAAGASPVRQGAPGAGAVAAAPSAARPATPVASPGATSAAGSRAAPAGPRQLITVTAASYQATYAALSAYRRTGHGWQRVFG